MKHKDEKYLLVLSEPHKPELPDTLEKLKLRFNKVILSRTVSADLSDLEVKKYDMLVFFSPSEIAALISAYGTEELPRIATFGDSTTRAAIDGGLSVSVMAPTPEAPSMARAIAIYLKKLASGEVPEPVRLEENTQAEEFVRSHEARPSRRKAR
jgi:uroporphyrinogen-III synthase